MGEDLRLGFVKVADQVKGFSFLVWPESGFTQDVFVHRSIADPALFAQGDAVVFKLHISPQGKPQAAAPVWKATGWEDGNDLKFAEHVGYVKKVNEWGNAFVDCPEIKASHQRDAFAHSSVVSACSLEVGETIAFNVHISAAGHPQVSIPCWKYCSDPVQLAWAGPAVLASGPQTPRQRPLPEKPKLEEMLFGTIKMSDETRGSASSNAQTPATLKTCTST